MDRNQHSFLAGARYSRVFPEASRGSEGVLHPPRPSFPSPAAEALRRARLAPVSRYVCSGCSTCSSCDVGPVPIALITDLQGAKDPHPPRPRRRLP